MPSKIPETTNKIKKKMSFNDVKPSYQHAAETTSQQVNEIFLPLYDEQNNDIQTLKNDVQIKQHSNVPAYQYADNTAKQEIGKTDKQHNTLLVEQSNSIHSSQQDGETLSQQEGKRKATFYLTEKAAKQIDELFVKGILRGKKKDKSALICEAIQLLYQTEIN